MRERIRETPPVVTKTSPSKTMPFPLDPPPVPNRSSSVSYTPIFASHLAVFHFAEQYLIPGLQDLARQKFSDALNVFQCYPEDAEDICRLIRSVYGDEDGTPSTSSFHDILSEYASRNLDALTKSTDFQTLLAEGGSFPPAVCTKVARLLGRQACAGPGSMRPDVVTVD